MTAINVSVTLRSAKGSVLTPTEVDNNFTAIKTALATIDLALFAPLASPTFSGTVTLSGGTANGVPYLNASKQIVTGSALTFDGTNFATTGTSSGSRIIATSTLADGSTTHLDTSASAFGIVGGSYSMGYKAISQHIWNLSGTFEQMRLTSTGLGIGTSSPASKLDVFDGTGDIATRTLIRARDDAQSASNVLAETKAIQFIGAANTEIGYLSFQHNQGYGELGSVDLAAIGSRPLRFFTSGSEQMRLTSTGLGIGTGSPGAKLDVLGSVRLGPAGSDTRFADGENKDIYLTYGSSAGILYIRTDDGSVRARIDSNGNLIQTVNTTAATLTINQTMTASIVNNTTLKLSVRGSDGVTRSVNLTLA